MPLRFRLAALLAVLAVAGCDSNNPGRDLAALDGSYALGELVFVPSATALETADVGARLDPNSTDLRIYAGDGDATLVTRFSGQGTRRTDLTATASRGRVTLAARTAEDQRELQDLLLPSSFNLSYDAGNANTLSGNISLSGIDLQAFDPQRYQGLRSESGTLRVRFDRL